MRLLIEKINKTIYIYKEYFIFFVCVIFSVYFLMSNQNSQILSLKIVIREFTGKIQEKFMWIPEIFTAMEENKILKEKNTALLIENSYLKEALIENKRLRSLLKLKDRGKNRYISADVVGKSLIEPVNTITLNVGSKDGIKKNFPVVNERGLVGKIIEVGDDFSLCQLITDRNFSVSARIRENRAPGILVWKYDNFAELKIPVSFQAKKGYHIVTSGDSNIYPRGIPIGIVYEFRKDENGLFKILKVKLNVNFYTIENVFVLSVPDESRIMSK